MRVVPGPQKRIKVPTKLVCYIDDTRSMDLLDPNDYGPKMIKATEII